MRSSSLISAAAFFKLSTAAYTLEDDYTTDFYSKFNFFTGPDPTNGFVKYVDEATAKSTNLINATAKGANFGVDVTNKTPEGRPSIRLESKKKYDTGLIVLDVTHMPFGCGTWPAFWTFGPNWPTGGEIDILEGVNEATHNGMTLHTGPGCSVGQDVSQFSGSVVTPNCDVAAVGQGKNVGCSIKDPSPQSYGAGLNEAGGAIFATEWNSAGISVWRFERGSAPADVLGDAPDPTKWGKPNAKFAGACNIDQMFAEQQIIIDTTFCGDWAGAETVWSNATTGSCASKAPTCKDWVRDNPQAFTDAYWEIAALKVYQNDGATTPVSPSGSALPSVPVAPSGTVPSVTPVVPTPSPVAPEVPPQNPVTPVVPTPSPAAPEVPPQSPVVPVVPTPSPAAPEVPPQSPVVAPINAAPSPAPNGENGMPGWNWPQAGKRRGAPTLGSTPGASSTSGSYPAGPTAARMARRQQAGKRDASSFGATSTSGSYPAGPTAARMARRQQAGKRDASSLGASSTSGSYPAGPTAARMARHIMDHRRRVAQHRARM
ncbi:hypothetical protein HBI16_136480 [Parastagonospora nodorum]|nr:hypothetical protein HBI16_136480 [Parastagonospora nodorum]